MSLQSWQEGDWSDNNAFLQALSGKAGIYVVTPEPMRPTKEGYLLVKIGLATLGVQQQKKARWTGLAARIDSYLLYWPRGVRIHGFVETNTNDQARALEQNIHAYLVSKQKQAQDLLHTHREEWFWLKPNHIQQLIQILATYYEGITSFFTVKPETKPYLLHATQIRKKPIQPMEAIDRTELESFMKQKKQIPPSTGKNKASHSKPAPLGKMKPRGLKPT